LSKADLTDTHTAYDVLLAAERQSAPGVVVLYSAEQAACVAFPVSGPSRIGRDPDVEIPIDDTKVSREHVRLEPTDGGVLVTDLGSRNGTFVDGEKVTRERARAPVGSTLRVGHSLLRVVADVRPYSSGENLDDRLVGGPSLAEVRRSIATLARSRLPVLLEGETGTGKELLARAVHDASGRDGELIAVNCAALPDHLVESELFGHARGAFSSSDRARQGLFRRANGGSLLLDEIGDLPLGAQAKLLRVLESGEVRGVGEDKASSVDVRVLSATNRDLDALVQSGGFREDLFHRVASARIVLPPLRERMEDVPALALHFCADSGLRLSVRAMERLMLQRWPGNVRELRNAVTEAIARAKALGKTAVDSEDLNLTRPAASPPSSRDADAELHQRVEQLLRDHAGNVSRVARELDMRRPALYELFRRLSIDPAVYRKA